MNGPIGTDPYTSGSSSGSEPTSPVLSHIPNFGASSLSTVQAGIGALGLQLAEKAGGLITRSTSMEIVERRAEAQGFVTLTLRKPDDWTFEPGQYVHVRSDRKRSKLKFPAILAVASGVNDQHLQLTGHPDWFGLSPNHCLNNAPGASLAIKGPKGTCFPVAQATPDTPVYLIAGGIGITPIRSVWRTLDAAMDAAIPCKLIYSTKKADMLLYADEMADMAKDPSRAIISLTQETKEGYATGRVSEHFGDNLPANGLYFICGPDAMVRDTVQQLFVRGVPLDRIYGSLQVLASQGGPVFRGDDNRFKV